MFRLLLYTLSLIAPVRMDTRETDRNLIMSIEMPGMKKEEIFIELKDDLLTISGEKKHEKKEENERYHRSERSYGKFVRSMSVPKGTKEVWKLNFTLYLFLLTFCCLQSDIRANYKDGVLELCLPKPPAEKMEERKRIAIQ